MKKIFLVLMLLSIAGCNNQSISILNDEVEKSKTEINKSVNDVKIKLEQGQEVIDNAQAILDKVETFTK